MHGYEAFAHRLRALKADPGRLAGKHEPGLPGTGCQAINDRRRKTEDRRQKAEDRRQRTEVRGQKMEDG